MSQREWTDFYALLGLYDPATGSGPGPSASARELKQARRLQLTVWHPDRFEPGTPGWQTANRRSQLINVAYQTLTNPDTRNTYHSAWLRHNPGYKGQLLVQPIEIGVTAPYEAASASGSARRTMSLLLLALVVVSGALVALYAYFHFAALPITAARLPRFSSAEFDPAGSGSRGAPDGPRPQAAVSAPMAAPEPTLIPETTGLQPSDAASGGGPSTSSGQAAGTSVDCCAQPFVREHIETGNAAVAMDLYPSGLESRGRLIVHVLAYSDPISADEDMDVWLLAGDSDTGWTEVKQVVTGMWPDARGIYTAELPAGEHYLLKQGPYLFDQQHIASGWGTGGFRRGIVFPIRPGKVTEIEVVLSRLEVELRDVEGQPLRDTRYRVRLCDVVADAVGDATMCSGNPVATLDQRGVATFHVGPGRYRVEAVPPSRSPRSAGSSAVAVIDAVVGVDDLVRETITVALSAPRPQ